MEYIIMAGGPAVRWNNYKNTTKHLMKIGEENLLERIVRQLKENNIDVNDISITCNNPLYEIPGVRKNEMIYDNKVYNMFYYKALNHEVTFLYGDTFYTDEDMKRIIETETDDILFFGTNVSIIGIKVNNFQKFKKYVEELRNHKVGRAGWAIYRKINNLPEDDYTSCHNFIKMPENNINVNTPDDYNRLIEEQSKMKDE